MFLASPGNRPGEANESAPENEISHDLFMKLIKCTYINYLTRFNKIAIQGTPQMAVD